MLNFLKESRKLINISHPIKFVIGNESCDLDSAVSALALAYYYTLRGQKTASGKQEEFCIPLLNIPKKDFPLKTEVAYYLRRYDISAEHLLFKDEIEEQQMQSSYIILVDHHVSPYAQRCIEVFDHRPFDETSQLPATCKKSLELVGSCATIIAHLILHESTEITEYHLILDLLYGAIVLDTVNFSKDACRATKLDHDVAEKIEKLLGVANPLEHRQKLFDDLCTARKDVSQLTASQLLYKDMKMITNAKGDIRIALPGFPISVQEFLQKPDAVEDIRNFARTESCSIVVLLGMKIEKDTVRRDVGVINIENPIIFNRILTNLQNSKEPTFGLEKIENDQIPDGQFFKQNNIKVTRKQILPIVKKSLE